MKITFVDDCQICDRSFTCFETVYYLPDNDCYICDDCVSSVYAVTKVTVEPRIFLGEDADESGKNILELLRTFKRSVDRSVWLDLMDRINYET
ncbi:hypothetical protein [Collibacillus ludicampi]|uniref:hypothetical protein n=1 Tax=Collibacillus ludicampi TaxID=2771369 RepID=UPI0024945BF9|nr:hypothetical protein [Collibacillus ludicampi]